MMFRVQLLDGPAEGFGYFSANDPEDVIAVARYSSVGDGDWLPVRSSERADCEFYQRVGTAINGGVITVSYSRLTAVGRYVEMDHGRYVEMDHGRPYFGGALWGS
jgi:hypothetical protein